MHIFYFVKYLSNPANCGDLTASNTTAATIKIINCGLADKSNSLIYCISGLYLCTIQISHLPSTGLTYTNLSKEQRLTAVQRLTALWAFCESGLGGVLHALQIPFTGLVVGGLAVIIITLIANFSQHHYSQILKSLLIVLLIKAMISPYTPFPAYIAVSFQALLGYCLFFLLRVNFFSILLLSTIALMESAIQKLLILTLFFGRSFWKASDELISFISQQFGMHTINGSQWIISIYLLIYFIGGIFIAWMAYKTIKIYSPNNTLPVLEPDTFINYQNNASVNPKKHKRLWIVAAILIIVSVLLFLLAPNTNQGWLAVVKTISWTSAVMLIWYMIISPLFTKLIRYVLNKKQGAYSTEISDVLSFFPALQQISQLAWHKSSSSKGLRRWPLFLATLIHWSLIYTTEPSFKKTV